MFEDTQLFGISMAPRVNRRGLVLITYLIAGMVIVAVLGLLRFLAAIPGHSILKSALALPASWLLIFFVQTVIPGSGNFKGLFGRFVPEQTFSFHVEAVRTLGLSQRVLDKQGQADEREILIRNAAYYLAFKILAWYGLVLVFGCAMALVNGQSELARGMVAVTAVPIVVMIFTLPQAIILWTEPDLVEETKV